MPHERKPKCIFPKGFGDASFRKLKTEECRVKLENFVCDMDAVGWPVRAIENTCPKVDQSSKGAFKGCFVDSKDRRMLGFFKYDLPAVNSPETCVEHCLRISAQLAGEFGSTSLLV